MKVHECMDVFGLVNTRRKAWGWGQRLEDGRGIGLRYKSDIVIFKIHRIWATQLCNSLRLVWKKKKGHASRVYTSVGVHVNPPHYGSRPLMGDDQHSNSQTPRPPTTLAAVSLRRSTLNLHGSSFPAPVSLLIFYVRQPYCWNSGAVIPDLATNTTVLNEGKLSNTPAVRHGNQVLR